MITVLVGSQVVSPGSEEYVSGNTAEFGPRFPDNIRYQAVASGEVHQLACNFLDAGTGVTAKMALYRQSDKVLIAQTGNFTAANGVNEIDVISPASVVSGEYYCIAITADAVTFVETDGSGAISLGKDSAINPSVAWPDPWTSTVSDSAPGLPAMWAQEVASATPTIRKSSTFDIETTLGTITTATLNSVNVFDHVTGQVGTTVSFAGAATDEITTSGEHSLVLGDGVGTETIAVQVNVVGVIPSNNPVQKDGAALASLTGVQLRITNGTALNGAQRYYTATATTDASGNLSNIDLSDTVAAIDDPVRLQILTAAGDSINATETVGLI